MLSRTLRFLIFLMFSHRALYLFFATALRPSFRAKKHVSVFRPSSAITTSCQHIMPTHVTLLDPWCVRTWIHYKTRRDADNHNWIFIKILRRMSNLSFGPSARLYYFVSSPRLDNVIRDILPSNSMQKPALKVVLLMKTRQSRISIDWYIGNMAVVADSWLESISSLRP